MAIARPVRVNKVSANATMQQWAVIALAIVTGSLMLLPTITAIFAIATHLGIVFIRDFVFSGNTVPPNIAWLSHDALSMQPLPDLCTQRILALTAQQA
ncbi:hypothetical protein N0V87_008479 [Didymella glomerata]|uniref:Uncharacterized protein n=1 Tax=Didymella glomerata TaxID=749621 RepID=A0A9W9BX22_9PLEO|nr:hypothetical protein N0V87_008479 [Didymella glomerata]